VQRFGRIRMIWVGLVILCVGLLVVCLLTALPATLGGAFLCSFGGSFVVTCTATVLGALHGEGGPAAITEANALATAVGAFAPLAVGLAVATSDSWRPALLLLLPVIAVLALVNRAVPPLPGAATRDALETRSRLTSRFWIAWAVVTAGIGVEFCLTLWAADMLQQRTGLAGGTAAACLTAFVVGMCVGRLVGGRLALRRPVDLLLQGALVVDASGFLLFWLSPQPVLAVAGLACCGLGTALFFPLGLVRAIAASGGQADRASARVGIGAALASGGGPFLLGALADASGIHLAMLVVPGLLVIAFVGLRLAPAPAQVRPA
jgi:predicted MFS family arabinose efflux permease